MGDGRSHRASSHEIELQAFDSGILLPTPSRGSRPKRTEASAGFGTRSQTLDLNLRFFTFSLHNLSSLSGKLKEHLPKNISFLWRKKC